ncbi:hypothetical protein HN873_055580 [Arachis hypogaea]
MRYSALSVAATWMVFLGAQDGPSFHDTMNEVCRWTQTLEQKSGLKRQTRDSPTPNFVGDPSVVKTKGAPKGKKERGKRRCTKCNSAGHELPKDPMASQETLAVPNTEVNALVQQEFGLGDLGLINGHETPIPPYGSHQWLLQTIWNLCSLPEKKRVLQLLLPEGSLQQSHDNSRGEAIRHHAKKSVIQLDEEIEKINFLNKKREWRTRDPHFCQAGRTILLVYRNVILKNEYQSSKLCEALYTNCEDMMDRLQVLRLPSKAKFNAGLQNCTHSFENECVRPSKTNYEQRITKWRAMTLPDRYIEHGSQKDQIQAAGLSSNHIVATALSLTNVQRNNRLLLNMQI